MEHNPELTAAYLAGKVDEYVKFAGRDTIMSNVKRDKAARWARIPDGRACDFCRMLGSRGFVYHSEETAGGEGNDYHPHCNCEIAVSFDPAMLYYEKNGVRVSRGFDPSAYPGYDPQALFEEYLQAGRRYTSGSRYRDYTRRRMDDKRFNAAMRRLSEARTLGELRAICDDIARTWPGGARNADPGQWAEMRRHVEALKEGMGVLSRERIARHGIGARTIGDFEVRVPGFEDSRIISGSEIEAEHIFAGAGSNPAKELRISGRLAEMYGGEASEWSHVSGDVWMFDPADGRIRKAEVHWFEHPTYGMQEFSWKRWRRT